MVPWKTAGEKKGLQMCFMHRQHGNDAPEVTGNQSADFANDAGKTD